jgi:hypothetical protein
MRSIQSMAAQARRQNDVNGLPCGDYVYTDPMRIENRYQSEGDVIRSKFGTIENWNAWELVHVIERATGRRVFDNEISSITGKELTITPSEVLATLDQSIYEVK